MKFFTRGHAVGEHSDGEYAEAVTRYRNRFAEISGRLPESLRRFATEVSLHDAVIERVEWDPAGRSLTIEFVALRVGVPRAYDSVVLEYGGVMLGEGRVETLRAVAHDRRTELLDFEVDFDEQSGHLTHRLLFSPRDEVTIDFRTFDCAVTPRDGFAVQLGGAFVVVERDDEVLG